MSDVQAQIKQIIDDNEVVLFMKGTRMFPQCGFSARAVDIFKRCGVKFKDVNVLADPAIRQGVKDFSNWPTIPQAYVKGEFVGGSDIILEMFESGELQQALGVEDATADAKPPAITITDKAKAAFSDALKDAGGDVLRFDVGPSFQYDLHVGPKQAKDFEVDAGGLTVHVAPSSAARADGTVIDFVDGPQGAGFKIDNPNEPPRVKNISPAEVKALLDAGEAIHFFDVRGDNERAIAKVDAAKPIDDKTLDALPKDATIVLMCHHGTRSRAAAEKILSQGYTDVHNVVGGIDAWSSTVDSNVPRY